MWYYIAIKTKNYPEISPTAGEYAFFMNLSGHYSTTDNFRIASRWDEPDHKAMWYFVHELRATTNHQEWSVIDENGTPIEEKKEARTFYVSKVNTIENVELKVTIERETFNEKFNGDKPIPNDVYYAALRINGKIKYMPVAKIGKKFYRYKHCLPAMDMTQDMWRW